ncbi:MAG: transposase [Cyanobacteria bacterium J06554_1]
MAYSSSLTDAEWEILEPLLPEVLPPRKKTRPPDWSYRDIIDGILYRLKNGCNWEDLPKDLPPYSTVYWHYKQWRDAGTIETLMTILHGQVRAQIKKTSMDHVFLTAWESMMTIFGQNLSIFRRLRFSSIMVIIRIP